MHLVVPVLKTNTWNTISKFLKANESQLQIVIKDLLARRQDPEQECALAMGRLDFAMKFPDDQTIDQKNRQVEIQGDYHPLG